MQFVVELIETLPNLPIYIEGEELLDEQRAALLVELGHQAQTNDAQNQAIVKVAQKVTTLQQVKVVAKWIVGAGGILTGGDLVHRLIDFILAAAKH